MGKPAVIPPGETTSDVTACRRCGGPVTGRAAIYGFGGYGSFPVCASCRPDIANATSAKGDARRGTKPALVKLGRILNDDRPAVVPRVVIVRRERPAETVTGLRARLAARNLPKWEES